MAAQERAPTSAELADQLRRLSVDLPAVLAVVPVPVFVLDRIGTIRWMNEQALEVFGDCRGEHYSVLVAPEARSLVNEQFARKMVGTTSTTSYEAVLLTREGERFYVDIDSVRAGDDSEAVGVFGLAELERPAERETAAGVHLTPRQLEILTLLAGGYSTAQIADRLHLSQDTVRNHVRGVLRGLSVHSRLEAVSRAHELRIV
jgi:PAS domain S-box-containing protein